MAGLCAPLSTLRRHPREYRRITRGQCGSLDLHCKDLHSLLLAGLPGAPNVLNSGQAPAYRDDERNGPPQHCDERRSNISAPSIGWSRIRYVLFGARGRPVVSSFLGRAPFRGGVDAELLANMGEFSGSAKRRSAIIARSIARPVSVKNSRGRRSSVSSRIRPRCTSPLAVGGSFGLRASGPPRQIFS